MFGQPSAAGLHALKLIQPVVRRGAGFLLNLTGRSPDSRFIGPVCLPIPCRNSGWFDRSSTLTVAGPCWIFTSFPYSYQGAFRTFSSISQPLTVWYPGKFMANHYSALKRVRQTERRTEFNRRNITRLRHQIRDMRRLITAKDAPGALKLLPETFSVIDRSAKLGVIKKNTAARYKSKLHLRIKSLATK
jgi:small subunit ribosomal protein S20